MTYSSFLLIVVFAYLLGSIPFGFLIAKAHGKDLRSIGSGNIGATNVSRALGRKWAYFCFVLDVFKGLIPMLVAFFFIKPSAFKSNTSEVIFIGLWLVVGCAAIIGHIFPVYLKFQGGKGVATSFGVALGLWPYFTISALFAVAIWAVFVLIWRFVSLASIGASVAFPVILVLEIAIVPTWDFTELWPLILASVAIPVIVIFRHRNNIRRLFKGTESKILVKQNNGI